MNSVLPYFLREALRQAWRQRLPTLVAVAALALAAMYGGAWALLWRNAEQWGRSLDRAEEVTVYLHVGLDDQAQVSVLKAVQVLDGVAEADLITPDQAVQTLSQDSQVKAALNLLGENPLPAALKVRLAVPDAAGAEALLARLRALPGVDEVDQGSSGIGNLMKASSIARSLLLGLLAVFSALALVIVAAVLRLAAWSRRGELGIMRLVGAGRGFIRAPFLLEGLFQGLMGGALAALALRALQGWIAMRLRLDLGTDLHVLLPRGVDSNLAVCLVLLTGLLGLFGAALALASVPLAYEGEEA
ncbi:MAG: cell division protein FtsX [bacterium]